MGLYSLRDCGATQQIRYDCLFQSGIESEEAFYDVEVKARAKNISVGVEQGVLLAKKQFRDNDTSGESQSHREDDGASPMWAGFPPATCEDIFSMPINKSPFAVWIFIGRHTK